MGKKRVEQRGEEDGEECLIKASKQLASSPKASKDALIKLLKGCGKALSDATQKSKSMKDAAEELCKAFIKTDLLKHKDKEVRLFAAACVCYILRLHAPNTPFSDAQLEEFFQLLVTVFHELADPASPHFQISLGVLETAAEVRFYLLALDLGTGSLVAEFFNALLDVVNVDNRALVERPILSVLSDILEESDDISQPLMDVILARLLNPARDENPTGYMLTQLLLQRTQLVVQPPIQRFLTNLLDGVRTESELAGNRSDLILQVHRSAPQITLPVIPHIQPGLQVESEERRLDTVDLVCKLLTQPGGHELLTDYPQLGEALLGRLNDRSPEVRQRVLAYAKGLVDHCVEDAERRKITEAVTSRLQDPDEKLRSAAAAALCEIAADHPNAVKAPQYMALAQRLRDKKLSVRKEVAAQVARLAKVWALRHEEGGPAPGKELIMDLTMGLCNIAAVSRDPELTSYILDDLFRNGVFPAKLPAASQAQWWAALWTKLSEQGRPALSTVLRGKCELQKHMYEVLRVRNAVRENRASQGGGALTAASGGSGSASAGGGSGSPDSRPMTPYTSTGTDPSAELESRLATLGIVLKDVGKADEGLQKLFAMKDNHIFKGLRTLATFGTPFAKAMAAAKDVQQRVGAKGAAAETVRALTARLVPNIISPEVLHAAMEASSDSPEAQRLVMDVASASPQLFAQSLTHVLDLFGEDDPLLSEVGARVLGTAGPYMLAHHSANGLKLPDTLAPRLQELSLSGSPAAAKAAIRALALTAGSQSAEPVLHDICSQLITKLRGIRGKEPHTEILAALKALSMVGRVLPSTFASFVDEMYDIVVNDLLSMNLSKGRPLPRAGGGARGSKWGLPSPDVDIKAAALKTLAQALVPDDPTTEIPESTKEVALGFLPTLAALTDPEANSEQFEGFRWHLQVPRQAKDQIRAAKRRRHSGTGSDSVNNLSSPESNLQSFSSVVSGGSPPEDNVDMDEDEDLPWEDMDEEEREEAIARRQNVSPDPAWLRTAAAAAMLRLARGYDSKTSGEDYLNVALACQDVFAQARLTLMRKVHKIVSFFLHRKPNAQRAAKYAALYALAGADPTDTNRRVAFTLLKEFAVGRRAAVEKVAAAAAAAGHSGTLINEMPEFILPFLVYLLSHHPDYDREVFEAQKAEPPSFTLDDDAPELNMEANFHSMLQLALEPLVLPHGPNINDPQEIARTLPATIKLLRQLKFCDVLALEGGGIDEEDSTKAREICDTALMMTRALADKASGHKAITPGKFPGGVALPKLCFAPRKDLTAGDKRPDGSDLPLGFKLHLREFYTRKYGNAAALPALKPKARSKPRTKARDEEVEQRVTAGIAGRGTTTNTPIKRRAAPAKRTKPKAPASKSPAAVRKAATPARQQPRRGAKEAAQDKFKDDSIPSDDDDEFLEISTEHGGAPAAAAALGRKEGGPLQSPLSGGGSGSSQENAAHTANRKPQSPLRQQQKGKAAKAASKAGVKKKTKA